MQRARFGAVVTAMATPFDLDGGLDLAGAVALARHLAASGSQALVVTGTTGEGPTLADDERIELWEAIASQVSVPVIAGSGTNDTAHSVILTKRAAEVGAAGILAVTPYYNRPSQTGIEAHLAAIASATTLPVIVYDIPVRTGRKIANETMLRLRASASNVIGVKDAAGDPVSTARLLAAAGDGFECYSGEDALTLPLLSIGAVGVISVASHWVGSELGEMIRRFFEGDVDGARELNAALLDAVAFQTSDEAPNPLPTKAVLRALGLPAGQCRLPLGPAPAGLDDRAVKMLAALESWRSGRLATATSTTAHG